MGLFFIAQVAGAVDHIPVGDFLAHTGGGEERLIGEGLGIDDDFFASFGVHHGVSAVHAGNDLAVDLIRGYHVDRQGHVADLDEAVAGHIDQHSVGALGHILAVDVVIHAPALLVLGITGLILAQDGLRVIHHEAAGGQAGGQFLALAEGDGEVGGIFALDLRCVANAVVYGGSQGVIRGEVLVLVAVDLGHLGALRGLAHGEVMGGGLEHIVAILIGHQYAALTVAEGSVPFADGQVGLGEGSVAGHEGVVACADHQVGGREVLGPGVVDGRALEAPLVTEHFLMHGPVVGVDHIADAVEGGHHAVGVAVFDHPLEGAHVDFAEYLLGGEGAYAAVVRTVMLLHVGEHVLGETGHALALRAGADHRGHGSSQEGIFGIVLEGTAIEGRTMNVGAGAAPGKAAQQQSLVAVHNALFGQQVDVPGSGRDGSGSPAGAAELHGAILAAVRAEEQIDQIIPAQAVHIGFPLLRGFVRSDGGHAVFYSGGSIGQTGQIGQGHVGFSALRPFGGYFGHIPGLAFFIHVGLVDFFRVQHGGFPVFQHPLFGGLSLGLFQASGAGDHILQQVFAGSVEVIHEHGLDFSARHQVIFALDAFRHGEGFGKHHIVGVAAGGEDIVAGVQFIALEAVLVGVVPVEGSHILGSHFDGHDVGLAGLEQLGLGVAHQHGGSFFDFAGDVGGGGVQFNNILAGHVASVGHLHLHGEDLGRIGDRLSGRSHQFPIERGVGQAVAEGIEHGFLIPGIAAASFSRVHVVGLGFIIAIADIDALAEFHVGIHGGAAVRVGQPGGHPVAVLVNILAHVGEVGKGRISGKVGGPDIGGMAGGVHITLEDLGCDPGALVADAAHPQDSVHAVLGVHRRIQFGNLHDHGGVDHDDDLLEVRLGQLDQFKLVVVQLQIMVIGIGMAFNAVCFGVHVFTAETADAHHGNIIVSLEGGDHGFAVIAHVGLKQLAGVIGFMLAAQYDEQVLVQGLGLGVDMEAFRFEAGKPVQRVLGAFGCAGTAASTVIVHGGDAKEGNITFVRSKGQRAVLILEQHLTLLGHLDVQAVARFKRLVDADVISIEVALRVHIAGNCRAQRGNAAQHHAERQCQRNDLLGHVFLFLSFGL